MSILGDHYWQGCAEGKILYHGCTNCGEVQTYPRPFCTSCGQKTNEWRESAKRGKVVGATTVHRAPTPEFTALVPYRLLLVDLDEGTRIMAHGDIELKVNDQVSIGFKQVGERHLPYCNRA
jgi:uncharacterized OB-fold protein